MIPRANITAWRASAPWAADEQVEQDLVISRALVELFTQPVLAEQVAFRGGTALHKLVFKAPLRYSEDIDLVQVASGPIGPVFTAVRKALDGWLGKPRSRRGEGRASLVYHFEAEPLPHAPMRLKVEVNTREHFAVMGLRKVPFTVSNPWFTGTTGLVTYEPEELLGTKLRALYQRSKGRDLFDLSEALRQLRGLNRQKVVECFIKYLAHNNTRVSRAEFEANMAAKIADDAFTGDIGPLLATAGASQFDAAEEWKRVHEAFITLLSGEPWKGGKRPSQKS